MATSTIASTCTSPADPHDTRNYEVDNKVNKCLACHSFKNASARRPPR